MVVASSATRRRGGYRNMYYTYILLSQKTKTFYIGQTDNLKRRFKEHNAGIGGEYSKRHKPFILLFYEAFLSKEDSLKQERFYKSGYGREVLKEKVKGSLSICGIV